MPSCCPSAPIRRTAFAWILSLTLTSSVFLTITLPPLFALLVDPFNQLRRFHEGQILPASQPRGDALHLPLPVADNQHVRDFLELRLSDFQTQLFIAEVPLRSDSSVFEYAQNLLSMGNIPVCDREDAGLERSQPYRKRPGVMLDEHPEESFQGSQDDPVNHGRPTSLPLPVHEKEIEPFRKSEITLDRGTLPFPVQRISQLHIDLGAVKGAVPFIYL